MAVAVENAHQIEDQAPAEADEEDELSESGFPRWSTGVYLKKKAKEISIVKESNNPKTIHLRFVNWDTEGIAREQQPAKRSVFDSKALCIPLRRILTIHQGIPKTTVIEPSISWSTGSISASSADEAMKCLIKDEIDQGVKAYRMIVYYYEMTNEADKVLRLKYLSIDFPRGDECRKWYFEIRSRIQKLNLLSDRPKRVLILANPFGGKKKARPVCEQQVVPLLKLCTVEFELVYTKSAEHCRSEITNRKDLLDFDGLLIAGGDGMYNLCMNALVRRFASPDGKKLAKPPIRMGVIPVGSLNCLAHTMYGNTLPITAVINIIKGDSTGVDTCAVRGSDGTLLQLGTTMISFGFMGDMLPRSEVLRCLGPERYKFAAIETWVKNRSHKGQIVFNPKFSDNMHDIPTMVHGFRQDGKLLVACQTDCSMCQSIQENTQPSSALDDNFANHIDNRFNHIIACVTPVISELSPAGVSPFGHLGDGTMDLALMSKISRLQQIKFAIASRFNAKHVHQNFIHLYRVKNFAFTPHDDVAEAGETSRNRIPSDKSDFSTTAGDGHVLTKEEIVPSTASDRIASNWNVDGEMLPQRYGQTFLFKVHRQLIQLFGRDFS